MAKASDNLFPYVHLVPAAAPAAPAAGAERIYLDSADGKLKRKNSAGTVTTVEAAPGGGTGDATWTAPTFLNSWVNFGSGYGNAGYRKDGQGIVHLQGMVKSGTVGSNIFVLPVGYRPPADVLMPVDAGTRPGNIIVRSTGEVVNNNGGNVYFSLYGVYFFV